MFRAFFFLCPGGARPRLAPHPCETGAFPRVLGLPPAPGGARPHLAPHLCGTGAFPRPAVPGLTSRRICAGRGLPPRPGSARPHLAPHLCRTGLSPAPGQCPEPPRAVFVRDGASPRARRCPNLPRAASVRDGGFPPAPGGARPRLAPHLCGTEDFPRARRCPAPPRAVFVRDGGFPPRHWEDSRFSSALCRCARRWAVDEGGAGTYNKTEVLFACEGEEFHENISH